MKKKSIKKNYIYNMCYQMIAVFVPLLTTPYLSRVLGPDGVGTVSYAESVVSYFSLFAALGITVYGQREISYVQDSRERRSHVFWETKILEFCTAGAVMILYYVFSIFQKEVALYFILSLNIAAVFIDVTWFFQGMEEFGKIVLRNIIIKILSILYIFIFVRTKENILSYVVGLSLFTFLSNASLWGYLPGYVDRVPLRELHPFRNINVVLSLFIPTIAIQIYTVLDRTMLGVITKDRFENGYYEQALKMSRMVLAAVTGLGTVMVPRIGYHFEKKEMDSVKNFMYRGYRFAWFLGIPLCLGLVMISDNFVPWFYGNDFGKVTILLKVLAFLILAVGINNVTGVQYLVPTKRQNIYTVSVLVGAGTNFILNLICIHFWRSVGAAVASVAAETTIAILQIYMVRTELSPLCILKESLHYIIAGGVMTAVLAVENNALTPSPLHTVILVLSGMIVYIMSLLIMHDVFFLSNVEWVLKKIKIRK